MDPIQNNGINNNYVMSTPQQQADIEQEDSSSMPMVYDAEMEEKKNAASSGIGMKALGLIAVAGLALWGGKAWGERSAKGVKEALKVAEEAKDKAVAQAKKLQDANDKAVTQAKKLQEANDKAYEIAEKKHMGLLDRKKDLRNDIKKALKPDENEAANVEEAAKTIETAAENTENKVVEEAK